MILSDKSIKERIKKGDIIVDPLNMDDIQPASIDLHLGNKFVIFKNYLTDIYDVKKNIDNTETVDIGGDGFFIVHPNEFILASTVESFKIPDDIVGRLEGRSSIGRTGLIVHMTAGFIDPGFKGNITLEMMNFSAIPIKIYPNMRICQIAFEELTTKADVPYGAKAVRNKYSGQSDPVPSRIWKEFREDK